MKIKRLLVFVLCFVLFVSIFSITAFAVKTDKIINQYKDASTLTSKDGLWEYSVRGTIFAYYGHEPNISLPSIIDEQQITAVWSIDNNNVESIYVPSNYTTLFTSCFSNLKKLKKVEFAQDYSPFQVKRFDDALFQNCPKLEKVILPNDMECGSHYNQDLDEYISGGALPNDLFYNCKSLKEVTFPDNLTEIGSKAFEGCTSIERIVIPEGVLAIDVGAFKDTPSLKTLVLPDSIEAKGLNGALGYMSSTTTIVCGKDSGTAKKIETLQKSAPDLYQFSVVNMTPTKVEGDINNDGRFNIKDATHLQKYLVGLVGAESVNNYVLDFNKDKKININDVTMMQYNIARISFEDN